MCCDAHKSQRRAFSASCELESKREKGKRNPRRCGTAANLVMICPMGGGCLRERLRAQVHADCLLTPSHSLFVR
jgi:hypothetical protein